MQMQHSAACVVSSVGTRPPLPSSAPSEHWGRGNTKKEQGNHFGAGREPGHDPRIAQNLGRRREVRVGQARVLWEWGNRDACAISGA